MTDYTRGVAFISVGGLEKLQVASQLTIVEMRAYLACIRVYTLLVTQTTISRCGGFEK